MDIRWIHFKKHPFKEVIKNLKTLWSAEKRAKNYNGEENYGDSATQYW